MTAKTEINLFRTKYRKTKKHCYKKIKTVSVIKAKFEVQDMNAMVPR
jgi:hypothetical protein